MIMSSNIYRPVIYVRGYSRGQSTVEDTVNLPYYGFNLGSTKVRTGPDRTPELLIFESPLVRLLRDHDYKDHFVRVSGTRLDFINEPAPPKEMPLKSLVIFRYYDETSDEVGSGKRFKIEDLAGQLARIVEHVRKATGAGRVDLVAHSMGGLICRSLIQRKWGGGEARERIGRLFTFGTPHSGIEFQHVFRAGEVLRDFFGRYDADTFGPKRMREYLGFPKRHPRSRLKELGGRFPPWRVFCLIGTNAGDYDVAWGWSSRAAGSQSDGLVKIANAYVRGSSRSYIHRSHSGPYGIVNSEEGYQNLERFLFGDMRVRISLAGVEFDRRADAYADLKFVLLESEVALRGGAVHIHERREEHLSAENMTPAELEEKGETVHETFLMRNRRVEIPGGGAPPESRFLVRLRLIPKYTRSRLFRSDKIYAGDETLFETSVIVAVADAESGGSRRIKVWLDGRGEGEPHADEKSTAWKRRPNHTR